MKLVGAAAVALISPVLLLVCGLLFVGGVLGGDSSEAAVQESGSATIVGDKAMPVAAGTRATTYRGHTGVDFPGGCNTPIYAVFDGTVTWEGVETGGAHVVFLRHADGTLVQYAHMPYGWPGVVVKTGDTVKAGQQIGVIGTTGRSSGCHLHFEVTLGTAPGTTQAWMSRTAPFNWLKKNGIAPVEQLCGSDNGQCPVDEWEHTGWFTS